MLLFCVLKLTISFFQSLYAIGQLTILDCLIITMFNLVPGRITLMLVNVSITWSMESSYARLISTCLSVQAHNQIHLDFEMFGYGYSINRCLIDRS